MTLMSYTEFIVQFVYTGCYEVMVMVVVGVTWPIGGLLVPPNYARKQWRILHSKQTLRSFVCLFVSFHSLEKSVAPHQFSPSDHQ